MLKFGNQHLYTLIEIDFDSLKNDEFFSPANVVYINSPYQIPISAREN
jgi:hypothetical protein